MLRQTGRFLGNNALGLLALLVATSGTAYAAATIGSADIINDSVKSIDVKNNGITSADLVDDGVSSADIRNGTVRAADLLTVPWRAVAAPSGNFNCDNPVNVGQFCKDDVASWQNYGGYQTARFRKSPTGEVQLEGLVKQTAQWQFLPIFVLPEGYRPAAPHLLPVACANETTDHVGVVEVGTGGAVALRIPYTLCQSTNYVSLSGVSFYAG
jgi:hypothetical protein